MANMSEQQLLRFISTLMERSLGNISALRQFGEMLKEEGAPDKYIELVESAQNGYFWLHDIVERTHMLTEQDIRGAEAKYRKMLEERQGRC
jgi:hypothetical protein